MMITKIFIYGIEWIVQRYTRASIGLKIKNYNNIAVIGKNFCRTKYNPISGKNLLIHNQGKRKNIRIGDNVVLECKINCNTEGLITIGNFTSIREKSIINCNKQIDIGNYCFIGDRVLIQDNDSHPEEPELRRRQSIEISNELSDTRMSKNDPIVIGDGVWIGTGAIILKGVKIGENSIIGAGAVVTKDVPPMYIAAGNPCKLIRPLEE